MPKKNASKNANQTQKIIVPKGTIDPNDDTVIEIPVGLHSQPVVLAKRKGQDNTLLSSFEDPGTCKSTSKCNTSVSSQSHADVTFPAHWFNSTQFAGPSDLTYSYKPSSVPDLDQTEMTEKEVVLKQLDEFQRARRKFLANTSVMGNKTSAANLTFVLPDLDIREKPLKMRHTRSIQTPEPLPPAIPPRPRLRDSIDLAIEKSMNKSFHKYMESRNKEEKLRKKNVSCPSSDIKSPASAKESDEDIAEQLNENIDSDSDDSEEAEDDQFGPKLNSTFTQPKKKKSSCQTCCNKPSGSRGEDKPSNHKKRKKIMEKPSRSSKTNDVSPSESSPTTNYNRGSKNKDVSERSKSLTADVDFEQIKEQLRGARRKLDEAVAMVSRTMESSSSRYSPGKITPESDASPTPSCLTPRTCPEKNFPEPSRYHDSRKCPLGNVLNESPSSRIRLRNMNESLLCVETCSEIETPPPCVSDDSRKREVETTSRKTMTSYTTIPCVPAFPCEKASTATATQDYNRSPMTSPRSLPTSSTKIEDSKPRACISSKPSEDSQHWTRYRDEDRRSYGTKESRNTEMNPLCSTICLNLDAPPCSPEEFLRKKAEELEKALRIVSSISVPCTRKFPCETPSAISRQSSVGRPSSASIRNPPVCSTRLEDVPRSRHHEDSYGYSRFRDDVDKKYTPEGKSTQFRVSENNKLMATKQPPCVSEKIREPPQQRPPSPPSQPPTNPCSPVYPCELVTIMLRQDGSSTRKAKSLPSSRTNIDEDREPEKPRSSSKTKEDNVKTSKESDTRSSPKRSGKDIEEKKKVLITMSTQTPPMEKTEKTVTKDDAEDKDKIGEKAKVEALKLPDEEKKSDKDASKSKKKKKEK